MNYDLTTTTTITDDDIDNLNSNDLEKTIDQHVSEITKLSQQVEILEKSLLACYRREKICLLEQ